MVETGRFGVCIKSKFRLPLSFSWKVGFPMDLRHLRDYAGDASGKRACRGQRSWSVRSNASKRPSRMIGLTIPSKIGKPFQKQPLYNICSKDQESKDQAFRTLPTNRIRSLIFVSSLEESLGGEAGLGICRVWGCNVCICGIKARVGRMTGEEFWGP